MNPRLVCLLPFAFALLSAACGGSVDPGANDAATDASDGGADAAPDAVPPSPVACGGASCGAGELCVVSCTGNPFYCDATDDAGACPAGEHLTTSCGYGPGAQADGGGCSNVVYGYACAARAPTQTTYTCPNGGPTVPIDSSGFAGCCMD